MATYIFAFTAPFAEQYGVADVTVKGRATQEVAEQAVDDYFSDVPDTNWREHVAYVTTPERQEGEDE